jgi:anti-anti-sigma regulatory factor
VTIVTTLGGDEPVLGGAAATVLVSGTLDRTGIACLRAQLAGLAAGGVSEVRLDLSGVRHHDRAVAWELTDGQARLRRRGTQLIITSAAATLRTELNRLADVAAPSPGRPSFSTSHVPGPRAVSRTPETADQL